MSNEESVDKKQVHLLIGNGFSIGIYEKFADPQLTNTEKSLAATNKAAHEELRNAQSKKIKEEFLEAIKTLHPGHIDKALKSNQINKYISIIYNFDSIYTLNYDLLLYWLLLEYNNNEDKWIDGFGENPNDNWTLKWPGRFVYSSNFFYLHGALHLIPSCENNGLVKLKRTIDQGILEQVDKRIKNNDPWPIFVCEGGSDKKNKHIQEYKYLQYVHHKISKIKGELVLYGVSLDDNDKHVWDVIDQNEHITQIYISYYENKEEIEKKAKEHFPELFRKKIIKYISVDFENLDKHVDF